jgi:ribosomal protein L29
MLPDLTFAEQQALEATKLESFPVNLEEIRRTIAQLLTEFGRYNIFNRIYDSQL